MTTKGQSRLNAKDRLVTYGIRPSMQRVAIMEYIMSHRTHPTIEEIYNSLAPEVRTLSKTTVYNTLRMFSEVGAAQMLTIDDHHICYDGDVHPHVHFICKQCGRVIDMMGVEAPLPPEQNIMGCSINEAQLYYKGVCADCKSKMS